MNYLQGTGTYFKIAGVAAAILIIAGIIAAIKVQGFIKRNFK